jgi:hypothetical protein
MAALSTGEVVAGYRIERLVKENRGWRALRASLA